MPRKLQNRVSAWAKKNLIITEGKRLFRVRSRQCANHYYTMRFSHMEHYECSCLANWVQSVIERGIDNNLTVGIYYFENNNFALHNAKISSSRSLNKMLAFHLVFLLQYAKIYYCLKIVVMTTDNTYLIIS